MAVKTQSQRKWLERQQKDIYVKKARKEGYRSRAAYKLIEIQEKYKILKQGQLILDLGAAPGSFSQVMQKYVGKTGQILGIDLLPIQPLDQNVTFIQDDFKSILNHITKKADGVISDLSPSACGIPEVDHLQLITMIEDMIALLPQLLKEHGFFVCKVFKGGLQQDLLMILKKYFKKVYHFKPQSSRKESAEEYVIALSFSSQ